MQEGLKEEGENGQAIDDCAGGASIRQTSCNPVPIIRVFGAADFFQDYTLNCSAIGNTLLLSLAPDLAKFNQFYWPR